MPLEQSDARVVLQQYDGVVIIPIPDPLLQEYQVEMIEQLLRHLHMNSAIGVVLDVSAVEVIDFQDFEFLRKVSQLAALMGSAVVLAGVRPGVAAGLALVGVDDHWAKTAMSVEKAVELLR